MPMIMVYITTKDKAEAHKIGRAVVEAKLAACANIIEQMQSIYHWQGQLQVDQESILLLKTKSEHFASIVKTVKEQHSYSCPCVLSWPLTDGSHDYLNWLEQNC